MNVYLRYDILVSSLKVGVLKINPDGIGVD